MSGTSSQDCHPRLLVSAVTVAPVAAAAVLATSGCVGGLDDDDDATEGDVDIGKGKVEGSDFFAAMSIFPRRDLI